MLHVRPGVTVWSASYCPSLTHWQVVAAQITISLFIMPQGMAWREANTPAACVSKHTRTDQRVAGVLLLHSCVTRTVASLGSASARVVLLSTLRRSAAATSARGDLGLCVGSVRSDACGAADHSGLTQQRNTLCDHTLSCLWDGLLVLDVLVEPGNDAVEVRCDRVLGNTCAGRTQEGYMSKHWWCVEETYCW